MKKCKIRVIVPCYNSDLTIEECISSILDSTGIEFELYLVDDGNNSKLNLLKNNYQYEVLKTTGKAGAGSARNLGTYGFDGEIVVFIDSDVQIQPDTIANLIRPIEENSAEATVGSYSKQCGENFFDSYKRFYLSYRYAKNQKYLNKTFWSAICAVDFTIFKKMKGFKECFSGAGPEDLDLGVELSILGARIFSVPEAQGKHLSVYSFSKLINNDLRKGSEDVYIHWTRKVSILNNRHVHRDDILAVVLACALPVLLLIQYIFGLLPLLMTGIFYFIVRIRFVKNAFGGEDFLFLIRSFLLTYALDLIRGYSAIRGTSFFILEILSSGKYKPFAKLSN
jgi:glycosyltransferase involved in cell wall biosynthesis